MRNRLRLSIAWAPFYASLAVITGLAIFMGIFWSINEYQAYKESVENIRSNYKQQYESRVREEVDAVTDYLDYRRQQDLLRAEATIRNRVQSAYTIASHTYRLYKDEKDVSELRQMVAEILRPIRWGDTRGYYFAGQVDSERIDLFADEPAFEGIDGRTFKILTGHDVLGDIRKIIRDKGAGLIRYELKKPNYPGKEYSKIAFVKYFAPFDWFIGAGMYRDDVTKSVQQDVLHQLQGMTFGETGEIFGFRFDGTIICNRDEKLLGRSITTLVDVQGKPYGEELFKAGTSSEGLDGFIIHQEYRDDKKGSAHYKLSYVRAYPEIDWVVGASMYMDAMEQAIADETAMYRLISFRNVSMFIVLFTLAVLLMLFSTYIYSLKIKRGIKSFTDFFRGAADSKEKMGKEQLDFVEFEGLSVLANKMVDEQLKNELLLHRDELRLDALLALGMMDKYSLQDKYDFILERIVQITGSEEGYIALVNENQSHITLTSYVVMEKEVAIRRHPDTIKSRAVQDGGVVGRAVLRKMAVVNNGCMYKSVDEVYPYETVPRRHLDVPIYNNGKIVMISGVCNNSEAYNNSDIRQMTMLLEGMWMHVLKKCAEEEKSRLEGQIIAVSEEERAAIGRDLHDDLCSHLSGVELLSKVLHQKLDQVAPAQAGQLGTIRDLIRDAIDKTRRLSHGLYPVHIVEYGLEAAIEELVVEVENMFRVVKCELEFEDNSDTTDTNLVIHLHYILREAVFNAARHGSPKNIRIRVHIDDENFLAQVKDDGCGFDEETNRKGLGFYTMEYRARMMGAHINITSRVDQGTSVAVSGVVG